MTQVARTAPTPVPPSIVTGSQSHTHDDETEEMIFSEANNNASSQPRPDATDDIAFSELIDAPSLSRPQSEQQQQQQQQQQHQGATAHTPERSRATGESETDEVQFFTETTHDAHTETASDAQPAQQQQQQQQEGDDGAAAPKATPANLDATARPSIVPTVASAPPPPSSTGTPSFLVEAESATMERDADDEDGEEVEVEAVAPPVPRTRGPGHTPRGARPDSAQPPTRPPSRTASRFGTPRVSRGDYVNSNNTNKGAPASQALVPETQSSRLPRLSVAQSDRSIAFQVEDEAAVGATPTEAGQGQGSSTPMMPRPSVAQSDRSIAFQVDDETAGTAMATPSESPQGQASRTPPMPRPSVAQSDRSIAFHVDDETSETASVAFQVEPSASKRRQSEVSVEQTTTQTDGSDIHFVVAPTDARDGVESSVAPSAHTDGSDIHFKVEQPRGSHVPGTTDRAATNSMTSLQFEVESTANNTRQSSISHFTVENDEPEPVPVPQPASDAEAVVPEEIVTESEERRREQKAEDNRRKKALEERSQYMNVRPWDSNAPSPRARRTSSQAAAHGRDQQEAEHREKAARRHQDMHARPWRTGMATTPRKSETAEKKKPQDGYDRPWRTHMATSPKKAEHVETKPKDQRPWRTGMATTPKKTRATPRRASPSEEEAEEEAETWPQTRNPKPAPPSPSTSASTSVASSVRRTAAAPEVTPLLPAKPVFDTVEAAKFVTPAPVLKAPLVVVGEEVEAWSEMASQQRNLQAILDVMRARERHCALHSAQCAAQENTVQQLNKELYTVRDAYVRRHGTDVTGMPLHARREAEEGKEAEDGAAAAAGAVTPNAVTDQEYMLLRLYPRQTHQATDYVAQQQQRKGGPAASVLSDDEMSEGEKDDFAEELASWRAERQALRKDRARLAHERRDLAFQMRRGSNIKDIKLTQPTSGRGPLDRRASGTETKVDVDGYDKLMDTRIAAQKAGVEAANAKEQYENLCMIAATMRKQHDGNTRELTDAQEVQEEAKERYAAALRSTRAQIEEARPLIDRAQATLKRREREAARTESESAHRELREYSDAILAVRLQVDRASALADAAGGDEERMRRASTPRAGGMSRNATPRGSVSGSLRPGASPRGRTNSVSNSDDVFARLTGRQPADGQNGVLAGTPMEASA